MHTINIIALVALLVTGCGLTTPADKLTVSAGDGVTAGTLSGVLHSLDGQTIDLGAGSARIQALMFVSETCSVCRAETKSLVADRSSRGIPTNADFYTVVVGSVPDDASDWKNDLKANWPVAIDANDPLFRSFCPGQQTPCLILRNPILNQYKTITGELPISAWESFTGAWSF
jgi:hypothetical protein